MTGRFLDHAQRRDWLRLSRCENVGPAGFRQLMARYGTATDALAALPELSRRGGLKRSLAVYSIEAAETDLERAADIGARFVVPGEPGYPPLLRHIDTAPPILCVKGNLEIAQRDAVAVVGARNASATAAHEAGLEAGTAAVLAGGLDVIYPPENQALHEEIASRGLLVSEMAPGTVPRAEHFPRRNRIISGMSRAVVVVEAALHSGSLITARLANEQGREVFAVPGSPLDPRCEGANRLIRDGATLLTKAEDVINALAGSSPRRRGDQFLETAEEPLAVDPQDSDRQRVLELLSPSSIDIDDLIRESGLAPQVVLAILLELELAGKVQRHGRQKVSLA